MTIAKKVETIIEKSSWIRKMFTEGARLKAEHGAENVFDFSLGNPNLPPPSQFSEALKDTVNTSGPVDHRYMPNTGFPQVCAVIAETVSAEQQAAVTGQEIIMTVGAAGALNVTLKAILDPGDEVISPAPCFVEYHFYTDNHGGVFKTAACRADHTLNLNALEEAITGRTKAVLINSPNNPTGQVYSAESLAQLGQLLRDKSTQYGRTIYLISDEPYRRIIFDGLQVPAIFPHYEDSIIATSYSKDLSIPGERIGYVAVNPKAAHRRQLLDGMALANRILGFVNAPALMQRVVARVQGASVDSSAYQRKRDLLCAGLADAGYEFVTPPGAFYLFPRTPIADDVAFVKELQQELILTVPGSGFHGPGHFRISFCVEDETITRALPGFKKVMQRYT
ncbi:MAG: aspartate aminotransferase [Deltaproteobacteria bacterium SG8_13]|nr:MAG: aspartate aminotransferase [Deltaproteobacteria bacterium SG8_13]